VGIFLIQAQVAGVCCVPRLPCLSHCVARGDPL